MILNYGATANANQKGVNESEILSLRERARYHFYLYNAESYKRSISLLTQGGNYYLASILLQCSGIYKGFTLDLGMLCFPVKGFQASSFTLMLNTLQLLKENGFIKMSAYHSAMVVGMR